MLLFKEIMTRKMNKKEALFETLFRMGWPNRHAASGVGNTTEFVWSRALVSFGDTGEATLLPQSPGSLTMGDPVKLLSSLISMSSSSKKRQKDMSKKRALQLLFLSHKRFTFSDNAGEETASKNGVEPQPAEGILAWHVGRAHPKYA